MTKKIQKFFLFLSLLPFSLFAAGTGGGFMDKLSGQFTTQVEGVSQSVAGMINTFTLYLGIIWVIICILVMAFAMEQAKTHMKLLLGVTLGFGIAYGISAAIM